MKIIIAAQVDVAPETRDEALKTAQKWIDGALEQPGCLRYDWSADMNNPKRINVFEEWESEEHLSAHFAGPEYIGMLQHMGSYTVLWSQARKFAVSNEATVYNEDGKPSAQF
ncbi:MAG: putative quinol monooxygenase [Pseudomonadota bacterium]